MTNLISGPGTGSSAAGLDDTQAQPPIDGDQPVEWAPMEPAPKKRRVGMWVGIGVGALALAAVGASLVLIAPGTTVAGVPVGFMTPGAAAEAVSTRLASTEVTLTGAGENVQVSGADLGASIDAAALTEQAFSERPMWNIGAWMGEPITGSVTLDAAAADRTLRSALPDSFVDPTDATVVFDKDAEKYVATPAAPGTGISLDSLTGALDEAVAAGSPQITFSEGATQVDPLITDEKAVATVEQLNGMLDTIGFYVGDERTVRVAPAVAASWITVAADGDELAITADPSIIQGVVDKLPDAVNREVVNAKNIVDSNGKILKAIVEGKEGRVLGDTSNVASDFAEKLAAGQPNYALPVNSTPFESTNLFRRIEVDLSEQRTYLYENEKLVHSYSVSTGKAGTETDKGRFRVYAQLRSQNMGREDTTKRPYYYTPNVPYVTYYNGDEALHGTYWHSNFGNPMSHGCVNMTVAAAQFTYQWATVGTEVWVHD